MLNENHSRVYQLGLRNPFSMGFDQDGQLFIANTGWNSWEEIETGPPGANFGWPYYEGGDNGVLVKTPGYQNLSTAAAFYAAVDNDTIEITPAYRAFSHDSAAPGFRNQAITGGDVIYTGTQYPTEFLNDFFFTNFIDGQVFVIDVNDSREVKFLYETQGVPVHFSQGPDGYVYYADLTQGIIGRLLIEPFQSGTGDRQSNQCRWRRGHGRRDQLRGRYVCVAEFAGAGITKLHLQQCHRHRRHGQRRALPERALR